ncbi:MAG: hypothetical protein GEV09_11265 [Pseudonocardiaceae bacterium]|nr:hypothetical protein [Pseudonocardiaceae bacterium]
MNAPRSEPGCPHRELAVGWALRGLEPAEESLFAAHLPDCAECRRTVQETEEVGAALAVTVPDAAPPDTLEQRILAVADGVDDSDAGADRGEVRSLHRHAPPRAARRSTGQVLTAAAVVALIAVAGALGVRVVQLDGERDRAARQLTGMSQLVDRMAEPDARPVALAATGGRPMAMLVAEQERLTLMPMGLQPNSSDQIYVLWGLGAGTPVALDSFDVPADSRIVHTVGSVPRAEAFTGFAISLEPGRTPPAAPSDVLATGEVDS